MRTAEFVCDPMAPQLARRRIRGWLGDHPAIPGSLVEDIVLCVSELVSNAYQAGCASLRLHYTEGADRVRVSVIDDAPGRPALRQRPAGGADVSGRGLAIVQALADSWGVDGATSGKEVWMEFPLGA